MKTLSTWRRPERRADSKTHPPVTIGIGFVGADNSVFLVSDSQMTWPAYKQSGYEKIARIAFTNDHFAGLVKAGDLEWANVFHETLAEIAATTNVTNEFSIRNTCELALKVVRKKILDAYFHESLPPGAGADWLKSRECQFLVAYVYGEEAYFYTMDLVAALPSRVNHKFAAIGSGSDLASYFLNNIDTTKLSDPTGIAVGVYAIEACIDHSPGCGPPVQGFVINKLGRWTRFGEGFSEHYRAGVRRLNTEHFATLAHKINAVVWGTPPKSR